MLRVALIGYGLSGQAFHAPLIEATEGLELAAIVTRDPRRRSEAAGRHRGAELYDDAGAAIAACDLAVVATPNRTHVPLALQAIEAGTPVVVDKPVATTAADARRVRDAADAAGVPVAVYHNRRWDGDFRTLRSLLDGGRLGTVSRLVSRFERWRPAVAGGWRESGDPEAGGGVLLDLGPHLVDQALQVFGPVARVYAEVDARRPGAEVPDDVFLALEHASGVRSHLAMGMLAGHVGPRFELRGDLGTYVVHGLDPQEAVLRGGGGPSDPGWGEAPEAAWGAIVAGDQSRTVPTERGGYEGFYAAMAAAVRDGGPVPVPIEDAIAALDVLEAAARSAAERTVVAVG